MPLYKIIIGSISAVLATICFISILIEAILKEKRKKNDKKNKHN